MSYNENIERLLVTFDLLRTGRVREVVVSDTLVASLPELLPRAVHLRDSAAAVREITGRLIYRALGKGG